jgi:hypothetical protein
LSCWRHCWQASADRVGMSPNDIKKTITQWKADHDRV